MIGQQVIINSFTGPIVRYVWGVTEDAVVAVSDDVYRRLQNGEDMLLMGFPPEDVYVSEDGSIPDNPNWDKMQNFIMT